MAIVYKRDYDHFCKSVASLMEQHDAVKDSIGAYHLKTFCGDLRVHVDGFEPKRSVLWVFTRVEKPDKVPECFKDRDFNKFSGKRNMCASDLHFLYNWLWQYVTSLTAAANFQDGGEGSVIC